MSALLWGLVLAALLAPLSLAVSASDEVAVQRLDNSVFEAPRAGGVRRWQATRGTRLMASADSDTARGSPIAKGAVLSSFGCVQADSAVWCEVRPLHGGARGYVEAADLALVAGPDGQIARGPNDSAQRAKRKRFDATGTVPCAQERGQTPAPCPIGVSRSTGGDAAAAVTFPNGFTRLLFFMHGEFISAAATMSGAGRDTDWHLEGGIHFIRADDQRFEIPNALISGE